MRFQQAPYLIADVVALLFIAHGNTSFGFLAPIIPYRSCKHYLVTQAKIYLRSHICHQPHTQFFILLTRLDSVEEQRSTRFASFSQALRQYTSFHALYLLRHTQKNAIKKATLMHSRPITSSSLNESSVCGIVESPSLFGLSVFA